MSRSAPRGLLAVGYHAGMPADERASAQHRFIDDARRLFQLVDKARRSTARTWHVYYVQNGDSGDLANMLQRAFNPKEAQQEKASGAGSTAPGRTQAKISDTSQSGFGNSNTQGGVACP